MFKKMLMSLFVVFAVAVPGVALAQDAMGEGLSELLPALVAAAQGGQWNLVIALALMVVVALATKVKFVAAWIPPKAKPWVAAVAGVLGAVATVVVGGGTWGAAVMSGLVTGAAASGFWSLIGKHVFGTKKNVENPDLQEGEVE